MTEEVLENVVEEQQKESVRPDYIPESYWVDGQVDVKKMASDLESSSKQVKDLRRIISQPKQNEQYDSLFDGRELSEAQKADMSFYVKLANKNGLSRKQAEQLYDDVSQVMQENQQKLYEEALQTAKNELGGEFQTMVDGLNAFASEKVKSGAWKEEDRQDFNNMAYNARSMRILSELINKQPRINLSGNTTPMSSEESLTKEVYDLSSAYHKLVKAGHGDEPQVQEMRAKLNKLKGEYDRMIEMRGITNDL
jgi:predicted  nucleic acid-binding Zn-ribbon protein